MYRVIIVDDESWAVMGIRNAFSWNDYGFEIIAETTSAEEAFEFICGKQPDVVFTDIRMPKYSGIDLIRMARERNIDTEFVIVSGFAEFAFAQEALKYGALDYILKPIDLNLADHLLKKINLHLMKKRNTKDSLILEGLVGNDVKELVLKEPFFTDSKNGSWNVLITYITPSENDKIEKLELLKGQNYYTLKMGSGKMLYIIKNLRDQLILEGDVNALQELNITSVGISNRTDSLKNAARLIKEADIAASKIFVTGESGIFIYEDNVQVIKPLLGRLQNAFEHSVFEEIADTIDTLRDAFITNRLGMNEVVYLWNQVISIVDKGNNEEDCFNGLEYLNYLEIKDRFKDFDALCSSIHDLFIQIEQQNYFAENENEIIHYFNQLVRYIDGHYAQELYIKDLAAKFYLNQFYCCRLFKKILGKTFSEYVLGLRIDKAQQLMKCTDLTIEEIALKVGYADYYYFCKVFKKYSGITPAKYRKN